ncbi:hypothetical protein NBRC116494_16830 [Aurantivibrio plasticivorans]
MKQVLLLGGAENTLAIARSLSSIGVKVSISSDEKSGAKYSRCCSQFYSPGSNQDLPSLWREILLENPREELVGRVVLCCSDEAIDFVSRNHEKLSSQYLLEINDPDLQLSLLDKFATVEMAKKIGIPTPSCWAHIESDPFYRSIDIQFPVLVKPIHSHLYRKVFKFKLLPVENREELEAHLKEVYSNGLEVMITEYVPGPDDLLCSYYTYVDESGKFLFDYTKSVIRRFPKNFGGGCYHISKWQPDVAELGKRFFEGIGYRGLGNIEFKRDPRDNTLKLIECNPRFTAAHELLVQSGMSTDKVVYSHLMGQPANAPTTFKDDKRLIYLWRDFSSFRQRKALGELTFIQWIKSIAAPQVFPYFRLSDPLPAVYQYVKIISGWFRRRLG